MPDTAADWFGPDAATFGDRVAGAREHAGMTQAQLARRLGIKKSTLTSWEEDLSEPRANKLSMLAGLLSVSISWLLTGEGDGMTSPLEEVTIPADMQAILQDLRELKSDLRAQADRAAKLEKKLRLLAGQPQA